METIKKVSFLAALLFAVAIGTVYATSNHTKIQQSFFDWLGGTDREFYNKMESITVGMTKNEVIKLLGTPDEINNDKEILQTHGRFGSGPGYGTKIENKNICLIYSHGNDISAHYFIDEKGRVCYINVGGT